MMMGVKKKKSQVFLWMERQLAFNGREEIKGCKATTATAAEEQSALGVAADVKIVKIH